MQCQDTIAAVASAAGLSARGIIRLSGPQAFRLAERVFHASEGRPLAEQPGWRRFTGQILLPESATLPAEAYIFRAPASYTRQEMVELHVPGSPAVIRLVLEGLLAAGARSAEPGEFTARAFLGGAMDLTAAEAVAATIAATSDEQLRAARALSEGELARRVRALREPLADLLALVEAHIDFADEPIQFISPSELSARLSSLAEQLADWLAHAVWQERLDDLPRVMLVGPPNVGKSTLLNRLTGLDRAICSPLRGTTRDLLAAPLSLAGGEVELIDAAGLEGGQPEQVEALARQAARSAAQVASLLLLVTDPESHLQAGQLARELSGRPLVGVLNKMDRLPADQRPTTAQRLSQAVGLPLEPVSALTGEGVDRLRAVLGRRLADDSLRGVQLLTLNSRHRAAIAGALAALKRTRPLVHAGPDADELDNPELIAHELREAMQELGAVTGEVPTEALLGRVFSRFCIGK